MRPVRVVVIDEDWWHPLEVLPVEDQKPVETLAARGACVVRSVSTMTRMLHGVRPTQVGQLNCGGQSLVWAGSWADNLPTSKLLRVPRQD